MSEGVGGVVALRLLLERWQAMEDAVVGGGLRYSGVLAVPVDEEEYAALRRLLGAVEGLVCSAGGARAGASAEAREIVREGG